MYVRTLDKTKAVRLILKCIPFLFSLTGFVPLLAQNLVPNPGFEMYVECPDSAGEMDNCISWGNEAYASSTDYFNACHTYIPGLNQAVGVPDNYVGTLWPYEGNAYVGMVLYYNTAPFYREFSKNRLTAPLLAGIPYRFSFRTALTCPVLNSNILGIQVSTLPPPANVPFVPPTLSPAVTVNSGFQWSLWEAEYVAGGGERYICIGNFNVDALTTGLTRTVTPVEIYAFIDEVSVMPVGQDVFVCDGDSVTLLAQGGSGYTWVAAADITGTVLSSAPTLTVNPTVTTSYIAYGAADTTVYNVYVNASPQVWLGDDTVLCRGMQLPLDVTVPGASYQWNNGAASPTFTVEAPDTYTVQVTSGACTVSDTIRVDYENCHCALYIPTAFTPDADDINPKFAPIPTADCELAEYSLGIYDRWGRLLYQTANPDQPWDGSLKGTGQPMGLYAYRVAYRFKGDVMRFRNGSILLGR